MGECLLFPKKISTFAPLKRREIRVGFGRMAEWSNAAVLKTVDLHGSGGSNPSSSAKAGAYGAPVLLQKRDSVNLILICYANALHFISLGGPPGPRSRSSPHSLQYLVPAFIRSLPFAMARVLSAVIIIPFAWRPSGTAVSLHDTIGDRPLLYHF